MHAQVILALVVASSATPTTFGGRQIKRLNNGVGKTPALGWNSWNIGGCAYANASSAINAANAFVSLGLKDLGYMYVNIDDCWPSKSRNSSGYLVPDPSKWPNGMKAVADKIHGLGLKMGLYGDSGTLTCMGYPGSIGYETKDADLLASWGIDYWKYDDCSTPSPDSQGRYTTMRNALEASGRAILYSMCAPYDNQAPFGASVGNSWRMHPDITDSWSSVADIANKAESLAQYAGPGGFNDLDMMEIGNGGLSTAEERAHMGLWAISKSPIILGTDLTKIKSSSLAIIKNKLLISISQDSLANQRRISSPQMLQGPTSGQLYPYWAGNLSDGVVIGLVAANGAATLSVNFKDVPGLGSGTYNWTEAYSNTTGRGTSVSVSLQSHDMAVYKVFT